MSEQYICGGGKYAVGGRSGKIIWLPVQKPDLPETIEVEGTVLYLKEKHHVSLVCVDEYIKKHNIDIPNLLENITKDFCDFVAENDILFIRYTGEFRFVERYQHEEDRKTVVAMCDISNLSDFIDNINEKYNVSFEHPPTHVTLYSNIKDRGIYLIDQEELTKRTKIIPDPVSGRLK